MLCYLLDEEVDQSLPSDNAHCARGGSSHSPHHHRCHVAADKRPSGRIATKNNNNALCVMQIWERAAKLLFNFQKPNNRFGSTPSIESINQRHQCWAKTNKRR